LSDNGTPTQSTPLPCQPGRLVIISGPSGAGKSTVVKRLLDTSPLPLTLSVSATTRQPRPGEQDGVDYHFLTREEFCRRREADEFLECMEVYGRGDWYGTLRHSVATGLKRGDWVLLEIDVQGALAVMERYPEVISIFLHPGSLSELENRLRRRGTDSQSAIARRMEVAAAEMQWLPRYRHEIINQDLETAVNQIAALLDQYRGESAACSMN
jgi:guanylate kinase